MEPKLKAAFGDLENGWIRLRISLDGESITIFASFTPRDSFLELTDALSSLLFYDGEVTATWNCEPVEIEMLFSRRGSRIDLEIYRYSDHRRGVENGERIFASVGTYAELCLPFWRALRDLQGRYSLDELDSRWNRPFPSPEIDLLTSKIRELSM